MSAAGYQTDERGNINLFPTQIIPVPGTAITANTPFDILSATAGLSIRVLGFCLGTSGSGVNVIFKSGAAGTEILRTPRLGFGQPVTSPPLGTGVKTNAAGDKLSLDVSASVTVDGFVLVTQVPIAEG